jgi:hypothetical protein
MQLSFKNVLPFPLSIGQTKGDRERAPNRDFSLILRIPFGARMIQTKSAKYEIIINHAANSATSPTDAEFIVSSICWRKDTVPNTKISFYYTFLYLSISTPSAISISPSLHLPPKRKRKYVDEKTTAKLITEPTSIASVPYSLLTTAILLTPLFFHCTLPLSVYVQYCTVSTEGSAVQKAEPVP